MYDLQHPSYGIGGDRINKMYEDILLGVSLVTVLLVLVLYFRRGSRSSHETRYWSGELPGSQAFDYSYSPGIRGAKGGLPIGMSPGSKQRDSRKRR
ncbi:MAG: hypothetical protein ACTSVT_03015 [Candidatus Thorarchaeota archaeon]